MRASIWQEGAWFSSPDTPVANAAGVNGTYTTGASPTTFDRTGVLDYCAIEDGVVRSTSTNKNSAAPVTVSATCTAAPYSPLNN